MKALFAAALAALLGAVALSGYAAPLPQPGAQSSATQAPLPSEEDKDKEKDKKDG